MTFRYDMRGKTSQQQSIVRQRDREEQRRKEESASTKIEIDDKTPDYEFDYDNLKRVLTAEEFIRVTEELSQYKDSIVKEVLHRERIGENDLKTEVETSDEHTGEEFLHSIYQSFHFSKVSNNVIRVTKVK